MNGVVFYVKIMPFWNLFVAKVVDVTITVDAVGVGYIEIDDDEFDVVGMGDDVKCDVAVVVSDLYCGETVDDRIATIVVVVNKAVTIKTTFNNKAKDDDFVVEQQPCVKVPNTVPRAKVMEHTKGFFLKNVIEI